MSVQGKLVGVYTKHVQYTCPHCGEAVCKPLESSVGSSMVGAAIGFALAGPLGAIIGGAAGSSASSSQTCPKTGRSYSVKY